MRVVVTGANGMLGSDVVAVASASGHEVIALGREDLDVTDPAAVERAIRRESPGAIFNCAAWTDVDGAEEHEAEASLVNGEGAAFVADAASKVDAELVHVSTDYVFDGTKEGPYLEGDATSPINAYGRSKLAGERAVELGCKRSFVVRTSWLFGPNGGNFVETMLRLSAGGEPVMVVTDQIGCPTYTGHLAIGLVRLLDGGAYGIHHMAAGGECSWYDFAKEIFMAASLDTKVVAADSATFSRPARRPANSVLRSARDAPIELPDWKRGLHDYMERRGSAEADEARGEVA